MNKHNNVELIGRLTKEANTFTHGEVKGMGFRLAVNDNYLKDASTVTNTFFFEVVAWNNFTDLDGLTPEELTKGKLVHIKGELRQETWIDEATQENRERIKILAKTISAVGPKA